MATKYRVEMIDPPKKRRDTKEFSEQESIRIFGEEFLPLYEQYWADRGKDRFGADLYMKGEAFISMWMGRGIRLFMAYDEQDKPAGFMLGIQHIPIFYDSMIFQVDAVWGPNPMFNPVIGALTDYLFEHRKFYDIDEIWLPDHTAYVPQGYSRGNLVGFHRVEC